MNNKFIKQMAAFMLCWSSAIKQKFAAYGFVYVGDKTTIHCFFFSWTMCDCQSLNFACE